MIRLEMGDPYGAQTCAWGNKTGRGSKKKCPLREYSLYLRAATEHTEQGSENQDLNLL